MVAAGDMRILLYTGKGGVGKTSAAAATALRCAELGYRTVVLSTDTAHSLADSFDLPLGPEPVGIGPNLWGQEADVYYSIEKHWATLQQYLAAVFTWQGIGDLLAEEIAVIPGMEEGIGLLWIDQHHREGRFDVIIVDCSPTAETLRLLSLPDTGRWWFERLFPIGKRATLMLGPLVRPFLDNMPLPDRDTLDAAKALFDQLGDLYRLLTDPEVSSVRLVMNPEMMVIREAQRSYTYLNLYGYATDAVICNRIFPAAEDGYFAGGLGLGAVRNVLGFSTSATGELAVRMLSGEGEDLVEGAWVLRSRLRRRSRSPAEERLAEGELEEEGLVWFEKNKRPKPTGPARLLAWLSPGQWTRSRGWPAWMCARRRAVIWPTSTRWPTSSSRRSTASATIFGAHGHLVRRCHPALPGAVPDPFGRLAAGPAGAGGN